MGMLSTFLARRGLAVLVLASLLFGSSIARAEDKISDEAKAYFRNGVNLIQSSPPNYQDAYYQFKLAYEKSGSWKVLGNLGLCALKLERDGEALEHYTNYLKSGGNDIDPEERKALERDSLLISGNSAVVNLTTVSPDANVIDARAGSSVPPQAYKFQGDSLTLRLRGGTHSITATAGDGRQERWEIVLSPGKTVEHRFDFSVAGAAVAAPAVAAQPGESPPQQTPAQQDQGAPAKKSSPLRTIGFVTAGVGVAAVVGGVITGVMARSAETKATDACDSNKVCRTSAASDFDSAKSLATVTNVLFIGGGVLAAAGVGMVIIGSKSAKEPAPAAFEPTLRLTPLVATDGAGLFATGTF